MGNFKASSSSSGFVSVTTVLILLAVIINIYPANAGASLKAVEEVAKDQGKTEVVSVHHHEIRERVLLPGGGVGVVKSFFTGAGRVGKGVTNAKPVRYTPWRPRFTVASPRFGPSPRLPSSRKGYGDFMLDQLYQALDKTCQPYCYINPSVGSCQCGRYYIYGLTPCTTNIVYYCCKGINRRCTVCCEGVGTYGYGPRPYIFP